MARALRHQEEKAQAGASGVVPLPGRGRCPEEPTERVPLCPPAPYSSQSAISVRAKLYLCWVLPCLWPCGSRAGKEGITAPVKAAESCYVREPQHQRLVIVFPHFWWKSMSRDVKVNSSPPRFPPLPPQLSSFKSAFVSSLQSTLPVKY